MPERSVETSNELAAQETQIARLVREDLSNAEVAPRPFISPLTVEWHLSEIFAKSADHLPATAAALTVSPGSDP
jgi:DNA-binding NarL/FixJ family response regulator